MEPGNAADEVSLEQLATRLQQDQESALGDVLRRLGPAVKRGLRVQFGPALRPEDIDEILSAALYRLWTTRHRYRDQVSSLYTWLSLLARHEAINRLRHRAARRTEAGPLGLSPEALKAPPPPAGSAMPGPARSRAWRDLEQILGQLSAVDQRILVAFAQTGGEGSWAADLAAEVGLKPGAIRARKRRLLAKVRAELKKRGHEVPE